MGAKPEQDLENTCDLSTNFYELLTSPGNEVTNLIFPNDDVEWLSWKHSEDNIASGKNVNVTVTAYVTPQTRLKPQEFLRELGESVFYSDRVLYSL